MELQEIILLKPETTSCQEREWEVHRAWGGGWARWVHCRTLQNSSQDHHVIVCIGFEIPVESSLQFPPLKVPEDDSHYDRSIIWSLAFTVLQGSYVTDNALWTLDWNYMCSYNTTVLIVFWGDIYKWSPRGFKIKHPLKLKVLQVLSSLNMQIIEDIW